MPKLFVVSDIHSHYTPLKKSLDEKGFDPNNEEHWLIVCGDAFDRGGETEEVLHFLMSLERKILVKGNHDILLEDLCVRRFPYSYDKSNGTVRTVMDLGGSSLPSEFGKCCDTVWNKTSAYRDLLVNYFETQNYIFVHSWIPTRKVEVNGYTDVSKWIPISKDEYMDYWRKANAVEWEEAMWGNPFKLWQHGLNKTGKTIVFGHWHCSYGHMWESIKTDNWISEFEKDAIWEPFYGEGIIGIDRCTAHTGEVNVIVLEDEFLDS